MGSQELLTRGLANQFMIEVRSGLSVSPSARCLPHQSRLKEARYAIDLPLTALAKLEEPVHLVDKDINGVVLHVRPRHSSPCKYHAQVSVS